MRNGLYSVLFNVGSDEGSGVAFLRGGRMWGGDGGFFYVGTLSGEDGAVSGQVHIGQHLHGVHNLFQGMTDFQLTLSGSSADDVISLVGESADGSGPTVNFRLTLVVAE